MNWDSLLASKHIESEQTHSDFSNKMDYQTIICSTLFRRLQDKAQVFPLDDDDYVRTRLTHSLEVSAIGKQLGAKVFRHLRALHAAPWFDTHSEDAFADVLLCAGLVHDIGNPPYGHFGEYAIREWFEMNLCRLKLGDQYVTDMLSEWQIEDLLRFEGNAQSIRLLTKTPYLGLNNGFNLSYSILGSIMKYPVSSVALKNGNSNGYKKNGYYFAERKLFSDMDRCMGLNGSRHPLSFLLEAADDIAYRTSDIEDAVVKKAIGYQQIAGKFKDTMERLAAQNSEIAQNAVVRLEKLMDLHEEELLNNARKADLTAIQRWNQFLQQTMIEDAVQSFALHYHELMEGIFHGDLFDGTPSCLIINTISQLCEKWIYSNSIKTVPELRGRRIIHSLLDQFMPAAILYDTDMKTSFIDRRIIDTVSGFYKSMYQIESAGLDERDRLYLRILMITDYVSGMTDNYAKRLYQELFT